MKWINFFAGITVIILSVSCSNTRITSSWKAPESETRLYKNIMVWGILPEADSTVRKQMETHMVNDLIGKGYHAVSSLAVYKAKAYTKMSAQEIVNEFKTTGVDAVMTLVLLDKQKEDKYYPSVLLNQTTYNSPNLDNYYTRIYDKVFTPGYYLSTTNYFWEAGLFEVDKDKRIYAVQTRSFDPATTELLAHENGLRILKDMIKKKIIVDQIPRED